MTNRDPSSHQLRTLSYTHIRTVLKGVLVETCWGGSCSRYMISFQESNRFS